MQAIVDTIHYLLFGAALYAIVTHVPLKEGLVIFLGIYAALKLVGRKTPEIG